MRLPQIPTSADNEGTAPFISLIIPAFNEEQLLPRLLDSVEVARSHYRGGPEKVEVIVVDNDSSDATARVAAERGCRVVVALPHVIAAVRNAGAAAAQGEILAFIDADSQIHPRTFDAIARALARPEIVAGTSRVALERWSLGLAVTFLMMLPLLVLLRFDTGVVFCRRRDFEAIGGYDESMRYAEDIKFLWEMRRLGKTRGQRLIRLRGVKALACTRKFDRWGEWHYLTFPWHLAWSRLRGSRSFEQVVDDYWYSGKR